MKKNLDEQMRSVSPEAVENVLRSGFTGYWRFITTSPFKYFWFAMLAFMVGMFILVAVLAVKTFSTISETQDRINNSGIHL